MKELVKCSTPGVTAAIASRHSGTARLALRLRGGEESETRARHNQQHHREEGGTRACHHKACDMRPSAQHPVCLHATHYRPQQMPRDSRVKARLGTRVPPQLDHVVQHACGVTTAAVVSPTRRELLRVQRTAPLSTAHGALASVAPPADLLHIGCSPITTRHPPSTIPSTTHRLRCCRRTRAGPQGRPPPCGGCPFQTPPAAVARRRTLA